MGTFLDNLVAATFEEVEKRERETSLERLVAMIDEQRPVRDFVAALTGPNLRLIAEIKRASPSKGDLNPSIDAASLARLYQDAGAAAISVLTEPRFFKGSLLDLAAVASTVTIPVLRKDFILDPYQIFEARAYGADAVLLIAAILSDEQLVNFLNITNSLGMAALIEVHDELELGRVLQLIDSPRSYPSFLKEGPAMNGNEKERVTCHCERLKGAKQSQRPEDETLRFAQGDNYFQSRHRDTEESNENSLSLWEPRTCLTAAEPRGTRQMMARVRASQIAIGINNRNLADFTVDLATTLRLRARVPMGVTLVSESGIRSRDDVAKLEAAGVNAILVGEAFVTSGDPQATIRSLLG